MRQNQNKKRLSQRRKGRKENHSIVGLKPNDSFFFASLASLRENLFQVFDSTQ
jgi:hypothetical protein